MTHIIWLWLLPLNIWQVAALIFLFSLKDKEKEKRCYNWREFFFIYRYHVQRWIPHIHPYVQIFMHVYITCTTVMNTLMFHAVVVTKPLLLLNRETCCEQKPNLFSKNIIQILTNIRYIEWKLYPAHHILCECRNAFPTFKGLRSERLPLWPFWNYLMNLISINKIFNFIKVIRLTIQSKFFRKIESWVLVASAHPSFNSKIYSKLW